MIEILPSLLAVLWCLSFPFVVMYVSYLHWAVKFHKECHLYWHKAYESEVKGDKPTENLDDTNWLNDPDWWKKGKKQK